MTPEAAIGRMDSFPIELPRWVVRPTPLPEELARGYWGRVAAANGYRTAKALSHGVSAALDRRGILHISRLMALVAGMGEYHFKLQHTYTYAHFCIRRPREVAAFCRECTREDLAFWGFSYWRREHQIPGVDWCPKHLTPLTTTTLDSLDRCPSRLLGSSAGSTERYLEPDPTILRYGDIATGLLHVRRVHASHHLRALIFRKVGDQRLRIDSRTNRPLLSDLALQTCPIDWLSHLFPTINTKREGKRFAPIDNIGIPGLPTADKSAYLLALALLYECADDAIRAVQTFDAFRSNGSNAAQKTWPAPPRPDQRLPLVSATRPVHADDLIEARQTSDCRGHGYEHSDVEVDRLQAALAEFRAGDSLAHVCSRYGLSTAEFEATLRHHLH